MKYIVNKDFAAGNSRFAAGQEIIDSDVTGPVPASRFAELGYLTEKPEPPADRAPEDVFVAAAEAPAESFEQAPEDPPARRPRKAAG